MATLEIHPDRLLPPDPSTRDIARSRYVAVRALPVISHRLSRNEALDTAYDLVVTCPREAFKL